MEMTIPKYRVYIRTDENNFVTQIEGECSLSNLGDLNAHDIHLIDEGEGERFYHAQGRYLTKPILDMASGCYNYKYINGEIAEVSDEEKAAIVANRPASPPTLQEQVEVTQAQAFYTAMMTDTLMEE